MMDLALALTTSWGVYNGADDRLMEMARNEREDLEERVGNAIEVAILAKAKRFLNSSACQKVIDSIWRYASPGWGALSCFDLSQQWQMCLSSAKQPFDSIGCTSSNIMDFVILTALFADLQTQSDTLL